MNNYNNLLSTFNGNSGYAKQVDKWVFDELDRDQKTFNELVSSLPGVFPIDVLASLVRLSSVGRLSSKYLSDVNVEISSNVSPDPDVRHHLNLPIPHPLHYDWRFSDLAVGKLVSMSQNMTKEGELIIFLGTPSLFQATLADRTRKYILFDNNKHMIDYLRGNGTGNNATCCDLQKDKIAEISANVIIADPPWYLDHLKSFIWAASKMCKIGGYLMVSMPPVGTRPGIKDELDELIAWTAKVGFRLSNKETSALPYISPPFERNVLSANGIRNIIPTWRKGDLLTFRREKNTPEGRPKCKYEDNKWNEYSIGNVDFFVRCNKSTKYLSPILKHVIPDDILPSVSSRDSRRKLADIWTSGNRIYSCEGTNILHIVLNSITTYNSIQDMVSKIINRKVSPEEMKEIEIAKAQIMEILKLEEFENISY